MSSSISVTFTSPTSGTVRLGGAVLGWVTANYRGRPGCENDACLAAIGEGKPYHATPKSGTQTLASYHAGTFEGAVALVLEACGLALSQDGTVAHHPGGTDEPAGAVATVGAPLPLIDAVLPEGAEAHLRFGAAVLVVQNDGGTVQLGSVGANLEGEEPARYELVTTTPAREPHEVALPGVQVVPAGKRTGLNLMGAPLGHLSPVRDGFSAFRSRFVPSGDYVGTYATAQDAAVALLHDAAVLVPGEDTLRCPACQHDDVACFAATEEREDEGDLWECAGCGAQGITLAYAAVVADAVRYLGHEQVFRVELDRAVAEVGRVNYVEGTTEADAAGCFDRLTANVVTVRRAVLGDAGELHALDPEAEVDEPFMGYTPGEDARDCRTRHARVGLG